MDICESRHYPTSVQVSGQTTECVGLHSRDCRPNNLGSLGVGDFPDNVLSADKASVGRERGCRPRGRDGVEVLHSHEHPVARLHALPAPVAALFGQLCRFVGSL